MQVIGKYFTRFGAVVTGLCTAFGHGRGKRAVSRTDSGAGSADGGTIPTMPQTRQVVFMSIRELVCTMACTHVARTLAIRADFGALLVCCVVMRVLVFLFRGFWRLSKTIYSDDGEA